MDGTRREVILNRRLSWVNGLAADFKSTSNTVQCFNVACFLLDICTMCANFFVTPEKSV